VAAIIPKRNITDFEFFPFQIYTLSDQFRPAGFTDNWHTVRVRGGFVMTNLVATSSYVNGTDGFWNYAESNNFSNQNSSNQIVTASYDITVPSSSYGPMWFWIEKTNPGPTETYNLRYSVTPTSVSSGNPNPWATFPSASANYIPVGYCDAYSSASQYTLLTRQLLYSDVLLSGGSSGGGTSANHNRGLWSASPPQPYYTFDQVYTTEGYFMSTIDNNSTAPTSGIGWIGILFNGNWM